MHEYEDNSITTFSICSSCDLLAIVHSHLYVSVLEKGIMYVFLHSASPCNFVIRAMGKIMSRSGESGPRIEINVPLFKLCLAQLLTPWRGMWLVVDSTEACGWGLTPQRRVAGGLHCSVSCHSRKCCRCLRKHIFFSVIALV